jgi:hypothetical protein
MPLGLKACEKPTCVVEEREISFERSTRCQRRLLLVVEDAVTDTSIQD